MIQEQNNGLYKFLIEPGPRTWRHLLFIFLITFIALGQSLFVFGEDTEVLGSKVYFFSAMLVVIYISFAYFNLYYLAPRILMKSNYAVYFLFFFGIIALILAGKYIIEDSILSTIGKGRVFNYIALLDGISNLTLNGICLAGMVVTPLFRQWVEDTNRIHTLESSQIKNSIEEIKNSLHPDFLFRTIDYASSRVKIHPHETSEVLLQLSAVLRYTLYDCKRAKVLLASDIDFIRNYLALEQQNQNYAFRYQIKTTAKPTLFIPPFLFMPFVQEITDQQPEEITLTYWTGDGMLKFTCVVPGLHMAQCNFGKAQKRLLAMYNQNFQLRRRLNSIEVQLKLC